MLRGRCNRLFVISLEPLRGASPAGPHGASPYRAVPYLKYNHISYIGWLRVASHNPAYPTSDNRSKDLQRLASIRAGQFLTYLGSMAWLSWQWVCLWRGLGLEHPILPIDH